MTHEEHVATPENPSPAATSAEPGSSSPRQTHGYLRNLFDERSIRPQNKLGQNFLIDLNLLDLLIRTAEISTEDVVLEVGCGTGSLTMRLAELAAAVLAVEIDDKFVALVTELAAGRPNLTLLHADILKNKNELDPQVLALLRAQGTGKRLKLVANLPYAVATPVIANLLLTDLPFERLVVTVQWEIAERMLAQPGSKDFGALSVLVQTLADVHLVRRLPPTVFWPRPQVDSAIVLIRPAAARRAQLHDVAAFRNFLRELYSHRRKSLCGALAAMPRLRQEKSKLDQKLVEMGLQGEVRAETIDLEQHRRLFQVFG
jgi:16S rRNA (adenine1518-N6/adenine1519-N6)-dimethyltransferase